MNIYCCCCKYHIKKLNYSNITQKCILIKGTRHIANIIVKQRGTRIYPGANVMKAGDDSVFATADGIVVYHERMNHKLVSVEAAK